VSFTLPDERWGAEWVVEIDTAAEARGEQADRQGTLKAEATFDVPGRSVRVLRVLEPTE
jgi:hypothetical protein